MNRGGSLSPWAGRALCLAAAVFWSTSGLFIKTLSQNAGWSGWQIAGFRGLFASAAFFVMAGPRTLKPTRHQFLIAMMVWPTLLVYVLAQTYTTTTNAIFLQYTSPLWVFLLAPLLLKEPPRRADLIAALPLTGGMVLIFMSRVPETGLRLPHPELGNVMGLLSGVGYAGLLLALRKWRDGSALLGLAWGNAVLAAVALAAGATVGGGLVALRPSTLAQAVFLGVVQIGVGYYLFQWSLRGITASEGSILSLLEPVLCPFWAWLAVGDAPGRLSVLGAAVIVATLVGHTLWTAGRRKIPGLPHSGTAG